VKMDEVERHKQKLTAPDADAWNNQMYKIRVFDQLVYDIDANLTNVLIGEDWKIWRVDFTRAFRLYKDLKDPKQNLVRCDRQLLERLKALDGNELAEKTKHYLTKDEVKAVMARRDKIVAHIQGLITEKGENEVLY
jgi:ribonucleotide reductase beta subunit family protein with ferritin-like domain